MTNFDIIGELRTYCEEAGIKFIWHKDAFYANIEASQPYEPEDLILVVDLKPLPKINGNKIGDIIYSGLFMIGRKFDELGTGSNLDEKALEKYDSRLLELTGLLVQHATAFSCDNNLLLEFSAFDYAFNLYDSNIDFVVCQNITFLQ